MGSSMVITWQALVSLILSKNAASVDDLPLPVGPVTNTIPGRSLAASLSSGGKLSDLKSGTSVGITRITIPQLPRCVKMFTRKRESDGTLYEMSQEPSSFSFSKACLLRPIRSFAIRAVSSGFSTPTPAIFNCTSSPFTSTGGARPGEKIKSLIFGAARNIVAMMVLVATGGAAAAAGVVEVPGIVGTATGTSISHSSIESSDKAPGRQGKFQYEACTQSPHQPSRLPVLKALVVLKARFGRVLVAVHRCIVGPACPPWRGFSLPAAGLAFMGSRSQGAARAITINGVSFTLG